MFLLADDEVEPPNLTVVDSAAVISVDDNFHRVLDNARQQVRADFAVGVERRVCVDLHRAGMRYICERQEKWRDIVS